jgi:hypothetical protein
VRSIVDTPLSQSEERVEEERTENVSDNERTHQGEKENRQDTPQDQSGAPEKVVNRKKNRHKSRVTRKHSHVEQTTKKNTLKQSCFN